MNAPHAHADHDSGRETGGNFPNSCIQAFELPKCLVSILPLSTWRARSSKLNELVSGSDTGGVLFTTSANGHWNALTGLGLSPVSTF